MAVTRSPPMYRMGGRSGTASQQALTVDETAPSITVATIAGNNVVDASEGAPDHVFGTTSGVRPARL